MAWREKKEQAGKCPSAFSVGWMNRYIPNTRKLFVHFSLPCRFPPPTPLRHGRGPVSPKVLYLHFIFESEQKSSQKL